MNRRDFTRICSTITPVLLLPGSSMALASKGSKAVSFFDDHPKVVKKHYANFCKTFREQALESGMDLKRANLFLNPVELVEKTIKAKKYTVTFTNIHKNEISLVNNGKEKLVIVR